MPAEMPQLSFNILHLLDDLNVLLTQVESSLKENKPITIRHKASHIGFDMRVDLSIHLGILESSIQDYGLQTTEPLIDVIEDDTHIKIIAQIPGIKKENITTLINDRHIDIRIKKDDNDIIYHNVPCNVAPDLVMIQSLRHNNSVLEIIFSKGDNNEHLI